jgi:hypothetical protein
MKSIKILTSVTIPKISLQYSYYFCFCFDNLMNYMYPLPICDSEKPDTMYMCIRRLIIIFLNMMEYSVWYVQ